jgi:hypothetical protein
VSREYCGAWSKSIWVKKRSHIISLVFIGALTIDGRAGDWESVIRKYTKKAVSATVRLIHFSSVTELVLAPDHPDIFPFPETRDPSDVTWRADIRPLIQVQEKVHSRGFVLLDGDVDCGFYRITSSGHGFGFRIDELSCQERSSQGSE